MVKEITPGRPPPAGVLETVTAVVAEVMPDEFWAVIVYVVEVVGYTSLLLIAATEPKPWSRETEVALEIIQFSSTVAPGATTDGLAVNKEITGRLPPGIGGIVLPTVTRVVAEVVPALF